MDHNRTIGSRIKTLRIKKKYTLKQLSEETGLSIGFLSQIERGISSVAIDSLAKIAGSLNVSLSSFFEEEKSRDSDPVVHSYERRHTQVSPQIIQSILSHSTEEFDILPRVFQLMPFANPDDSTLEMYSHSGEEFLYVLVGIVNVWLDGRCYPLYPGDSIQIRSNQPHNWINCTNQVAFLLSVNYPNPFKQGTAHEFVL